MATITSIYTSSWDREASLFQPQHLSTTDVPHICLAVLIDWSLLQPNAKFLRTELLFREVPYVYYLAMFTNVCIRFMWLIYIRPHEGINIRLRGFSQSSAAT